MSADCYALEAKAKTDSLVLNKVVRLEKDVSETDRYGRLLRYVYVTVEEAGEVMVNAVLVSDGYALAWTYPPDVEYATWFAQLQQEAREAGEGLWGACGMPTMSPAPTDSPTAIATDTYAPWPTSTATLTATPTPTSRGGDTVYITATGSKYHRAGCRYLTNGGTPGSCSWAIANGYMACSVCKPSRP